MITKKVKSLIFILSALALTLTLSIAAGINPKSVQANAAPAAGIKIAVLSDTHYYPSSYIKNNTDFTQQRKLDSLILESSGIFDSALNQIKEDAPNILLVTGDLTAHGELQGHEEVSEKLVNFQNETGIKVLVINGNSDINSTNAISFLTGKKSPSTAIKPAAFKELYADLGYNGATAVYTPPVGEYSGAMSYATSFKGYTFLAIDTAKYTFDVTTNGVDEPESGGYISPALLKWIQEQSAAAQAKGEAVVVFQHHGLINPFSYNETFSDYIMSDCADIAEAYAAAKIELLFSSQYHANDIATYTSANGKKLYDVQTGSLTSYPSPYRIVNLSAASSNDGVAITVDVDTKYVTKVTFNNKLTSRNETIDNFTEYSKQKTTMTAESVHLTVDEMAQSAIKDFVKKDADGKGGMEKLWEEQYAATIKALILDALTGELPTTRETAKKLETSRIGDVAGGSAGDLSKLITAKYYYDADEAQKDVSKKDEKLILMMSIALPLPSALLGFDVTNIELYIHINDIVGIFKNMLVDFETNYLKDFEYLSGELKIVVDQLMQHRIEGVDADLLEIINIMYLGYLAGNEQSNEKIDKLFEVLATGNNSSIDKILTEIINPAVKKIIDNVMEETEFSIQDILYDGNSDGKEFLKLLYGGHIASSAIAQYRPAIYGFMGADENGTFTIKGLMEKFGDFGGESTGDEETIEERIMSMLLTDDNIIMMNRALTDAVGILGVDSNYTEDIKTQFTIAGFIKEKGGCGCGTVDFTSFITMIGLVVFAASFVLLLGKRRQPVKVAQ